MSRPLCLLGVIVTFLTGTGSAYRDVEILEPIRATGDEVALIFTARSSRHGELYRKTAQAIQEASELRVWVALNERYFRSYAGLYRIPKTPEDSISALKKAGMTSENYVGVVHGTGKYFLQDAAKDSKLKAIVLMGSTLRRKQSLHDYPLPVLTLAAELDGVTRITRMAVEYEKLKKDIIDSFANLYRSPVILLEGVSHAQFASGSMPDNIKYNDLVPDVTEDDAHRLVGKHVDSFLTATFSSSPSQVNNAVKDIENAFSKSIEKFQPFLDMKALDVNGNVSRWTILAQRHIAGEFADEISISNGVRRSLLFSKCNPSITRQGDTVVVNTCSVEQERGPDAKRKVSKESPFEIDMKLNTKDAIWQALTSRDNRTHLDGPHTSLRSKPTTCKSLNELALEVALNHSSPQARDRYKIRGKQIVFEEDNLMGAGILWSMRPFFTWEYDRGLHVQAITHVIPITSKSNPGTLYCKLISPYWAMEWVNVDSLRPDPDSLD